MLHCHLFPKVFVMHQKANHYKSSTMNIFVTFLLTSLLCQLSTNIYLFSNAIQETLSLASLVHLINCKDEYFTFAKRIKLHGDIT